MSFIIDFFSDLAGLSDESKYHLWMPEVEKKIIKAQGLLSSLMGKNDRVTQIQDLTKKVYQSLNELNPELLIEDFVGDKRSCQLMQQIRVLLLNLWSKLLLLLDKVDDTRIQALFIETIHRIMVRSEFDAVHLCIDDAGRPCCNPEYTQAFKRYRQLLLNTHAHVALKLADSKPLPYTSSVLFGLELPMAYSKILAVNFFRLPDVGFLIVQNLTLDRQASYKLSDYEEKHDEEYWERKRKRKEEKRNRKKLSDKLPSNLGFIDLLNDDDDDDDDDDLDPMIDRNIFSENISNFGMSPSMENKNQEAIPSSVINKEDLDSKIPNLEEIELMEIKIKKEKIDTEVEINNNNNNNNGDIKIISEENFMEKKIEENNEKIPIKIEDPENLSSQEDLVLKNEYFFGEDETMYEINNKEHSLDPSVAVKLVESHPRLFAWAKFHSALLLSQSNTTIYGKTVNTGVVLSREASLGASTENKAWTNWFSSRSVLFIFFVKDFVDHVNRMLRTNHFLLQPGRPISRIISKKLTIDWQAIQGYQQILDTFLYTLQHCPRMTQPLMTACVSVLHCEPSIINYLNRMVLSRTAMYNLHQVIATILKLQTWLNEFKEMKRPLPSNFDLPYLCTALDAILSLDHHQLLQRILQLLYDIIDIFTGNLRKNFISEFLLKKYFFKLFLHWDEITRNYFHQFLLWKAVRVRRSSGAGTEFYPLGKDKFNSFIDNEVEFNNDLALLGKIQCYIQVAQEQYKARQKKKNEIVKDEVQLVDSFDKNLEIYVPRALSEYQFFQTRYFAWESVAKDKEWKLLPLALLDAKRRNNFHPSFLQQKEM